MSSVQIIVLLLAVGLTQQQTNDLKVSIYYEALCPDSISFIRDQLKSGMSIVGDYINLEFVPYGKASHIKSDGKWKFSCQHGPRECFGNKAQACALNQELTQNEKVDFIYCVMTSKNNYKLSVFEKCSQGTKVSMDKINECLSSGQGDELLAKYGDQTHAVDPLITFIPTITFNDVNDNDLSEDARNDFVYAVCSQLETKPSNCPSDRKREFWYL